MIEFADKILLLSQLTGEARAKAEAGVALMPVRRGRVVITHGAEAGDVFFVLEGELDVRFYTAKGQEVLLDRLVPGDALGHLAAFDRRPRIATVIAVTDGLLAGMSQEAFLAAVQATAEGALWLASQFATKARELTERIFEFSTLPVAGRLHCELLRMARRAGLDGNRASLAAGFTHADFAARLGTHREAVTRELGGLQRAGIVSHRRRRIEILDVDALARLVSRSNGDRRTQAVPDSSPGP
jgi:CRP-like cAMP-binding protein